jgi:hypothetical protein
MIVVVHRSGLATMLSCHLETRTTLIRNKFVAHRRAGRSSVAVFQPSSQTLENTKRTDGDRMDEQSAPSVRNDATSRDLRWEQY